MAKKIIESKCSTNSGNTADPKELCRRADKVVEGAVYLLLALQDIGKHLEDCPFSGETMQICIQSLIEQARSQTALMPTPTDLKAAKHVGALMRDAHAVLDTMYEGADLLDSGCVHAAKRESGAGAIGAAIESLANKAGTAIESAAASMGADEAMFCFYSPSQEAREAA